ncbi:MAG: DUF308 domain-containing protein [Clostridia bacterium]|nr:DUF308 domain-containing protein [Clostridia bacterium]
MAKKSNSELVSSLLYILIGAVLVIFRSQTLGWAMTIAGVLFIVFGILDLIRTNLAGGAFSLIIGIAILVLGWAATQIVLLVLGILIAIKGVIALVNALQARKKKLLNIIFPIVSIVIGLMLAFGNGLDIMIMIAGILLTVDGIFGLFASLSKR